MTTTLALDRISERPAELDHVPTRRVARIELRKMFDTRSGFWLLASIVIVALLTMMATILFAPASDLTYYTFAKALGFPMTVILPIIAILAITGEWSQRTGLTTFTLVPRRQRVILAKIIASVTVGVVAMLFAFVTGAVGNLLGTAITGADLVWDVSFAHGVNIVIGSLLALLTGTMLGILFRSSPVALVAYFVYTLLLPTVFGILAANQEWFGDIQPWVDLNNAQAALFEGTLTGSQWANLAVTAATWILLPALLGLRLIAKSEVK
jgi:ABC-type transport system involved in multi-copper enzyme maturation permease subunit